ncbi:hypothetical protein [Deinococcus multiflagellatus]|uniref:Lasso RiPP family leader peptide-containing protein n=1 Tax=Deinococcus multiflagellatus TaxID=1656887 RepID=A0ABW1ZRI6_9DEIO|nr:hypothetical protein [Deinococcus multiflagellatus]MBZ9715885.1 hypothetical protein [Deinococcus multiflagellatus]
MTTPETSCSTPAPVSTPTRVYEPPRLEPLGRWEVTTLAQSVPIGPGPGRLPLPGVGTEDTTF